MKVYIDTVWAKNEDDGKEAIVKHLSLDATGQEIGEMVSKALKEVFHLP